MKKIIIIILIVGVIFVVWKIGYFLSSSLEIKSEYLDGKIITNLEIEDTHNIESTKFRYKTYYLEQYINVDPRVEVYSFPEYKKSHSYEIQDDLFQGKKNYMEVEVIIDFKDSSKKIIEKIDIENIKEKTYNDFVIVSHTVNNEVHYSVDGLMAIIDQDSYDEDIIFYSNPNYENSNITVGFQKDYALYSLKSYSVISQDEAIENNYEGFSVIEATKEQEADETSILIEYGTYDLIWDGLYPYDLSGNEILYESNDGVINLFIDGEVTEISEASHEKHREIKDKLPNIRFKILK